MITNKLNDYIYAISSEIPIASGQKGVVEPGRAHYSYRSVRDKFCDMLNESSEQWIDMLHPEIYRNFNLAHTIYNEFPGKKVHISFKPAQYLRTAGGFTNIAHVAWEFDKFRSKYATTPVLPANDDIRMLSAFDQIWVGCEFTRKVFIENGLKNTFTVPAPIKTPQRIAERTKTSLLAKLDQVKKLNMQCYPVSVRNHGFLYAQHSTVHSSRELSRILQPIIKEGGKSFLQILNPHDSRKNLKKLIKAFHSFHYKNPNSALILKFTSPEKNDSVYEILRWFLDDSHALDANGIYFTTDYIPESSKYDFMALFDFYVTPSRAEGQNLPLQEAMALGITPISTRNTAMLDYITKDNAFIIDSRPTEINHLTCSDQSIWGFEWHDCTEIDIYRTLIKAFNAMPAEISEKRVLSQDTISEKYSYKAVTQLMLTALAEQK
ncbi:MULTISPECIES: glycosyltransferase [unclassified Pseudomonas]|uniref:glycosyltransferase n=1 Tax=unclassified Pseudomonas TaxID=196821 RepID=UPI002579E42D|nr:MULTISPECIES: glycosyltransferase [unclassified Pseudomonas]